jgi:translation elongation factor EF-Tu-like GTPase
MNASFKIDSLFQLTGRGVVLAGTILCGIVRKGMKITWPGNHQYVISSVESIHGDRGQPLIGIVIEATQPDELHELKNCFTRGQVVTITPADADL